VKKQKNQFSYRIAIFEKFKKLPSYPPVLWQFFHENCWFCNVSEISKMNDSLILIFFFPFKKLKPAILWFWKF
jgi:hypothetical protein